MRIIFLDIDGVLVNRSSFRLPRPHGYTSAHPDCVAAFNTLIAATGALIVVSSVWRIGRTLAQLRHILHDDFGVDGEVIDKTPRLTVTKDFQGVPGKVEVSDERGNEIDYWLRSDHREPIDSYVILDDDADMGKHLNRLVQTQFETGLTVDDAARAVLVLNGERIAAAMEKRP